MKRRISAEEDSSSVEVEQITLNIDKYLNELGRSFDQLNQTKLPSYMHEFAKSSVANLREFSFSQKAAADQQPSTSSGDENLSENLSSANSQTAMVRRSSNLDLYRSQERLNKNDLRSFSSSQQNLAANFSNQFGNQHSNFNHSSPNYLDRTQPHLSNDHHVITNEDEDEQSDSIQFTTPFEFKHNKKFSKHSKSRYLTSCLPSIELRWRNVTYLAKDISSTKERHTTNVRFVGGKRLILDKQSGELQGGELVGIIGPSGAGL